MCTLSNYFSDPGATSWRGRNEASETLSGLNNRNWRYMLLASERSKRDTLRCNAIEISLYLFIYIVRRTSFSARASGKVGEVKCQLFLKHSNRNHWKRALKMIFKGSRCFQFPEAVVTSTVKESLCSTERCSLQDLAD